MIENIKARFTAVKYNIWTEQIDLKRKSDSFLSGDWYANGKLYYGHPLFIFFESSQNSWFQQSEAQFNITKLKGGNK
jgi:hypothetical protein